MLPIISGNIKQNMRYWTCIYSGVCFKSGLSTPLQDYWIKGLILPLRIISENILELYMQRVYWEEGGKSDMISLNIVVRGFLAIPNLDFMLSEVIYTGKLISNLGSDYKPKRGDKNYGK